MPKINDSIRNIDNVICRHLDNIEDSFRGAISQLNWLVVLGHHFNLGIQQMQEDLQHEKGRVFKVSLILMYLREALFKKEFRQAMLYHR